MNNNRNYCVNIALFLIVLLSFSANSQAQNSECKDKLVAFEEFAKTNNFDDSTYEPWLELKKKCPKSDEAIYLIGQTILKQKT